jgi:hypothetical protein
MSSLDFIQIQEECTALLKTKSHSFKALPALFLLDNDVKYESGSNIGPNVIMVRTLPAMKMSLPESIVTPVSKSRMMTIVVNFCFYFRVTACQKACVIKSLTFSYCFQPITE